MRGLRGVAEEQRERLRQDRRVDADTWLWGDAEPDYEGELTAEVIRIAAGDETRKVALRKVADRLLDRRHVRKASGEERDLATVLLDGVGVCEGVGDVDV